LAIFVALFTFISIEFQIFRSFTSWQSAASLTLILLGALTFFVLLVDYLLAKRTKEFLILVFFMPICLFSAGIYFFSQSKVVDSDYVLISKELKDSMEKEKRNTEILNCLKQVGYFKQKCFEE
jgi:hypothetical protein